jgi:hypothetical protein
VGDGGIEKIHRKWILFLVNVMLSSQYLNSYLNEQNLVDTFISEK